jgi:hypothetical protein
VGRIQEACGGNKTGIVQSVWWLLWAGRPRNRGFDPRQAGSEAHPVFYSMGAGCSLPGGKGVGEWSWNSSPFSAEDKNYLNYQHLPLCPFFGVYICSGTLYLYHDRDRGVVLGNTTVKLQST